MSGAVAMRVADAPEADVPGALDELDRRLLAATQAGLPLVPRPWAELARTLGSCESELLRRMRRLQASGIVKRFGIVVRHHELGYRANAMVAWTLASERVDEVAERLTGLPFVTLCYRRTPRPPAWPHNLFVMIHGTDREVVCRQIEEARTAAGIEDAPHAVLFSRRRFKQCGGRYVEPDVGAGEGADG